jgi:hypothetical protein
VTDGSLSTAKIRRAATLMTCLEAAVFVPIRAGLALMMYDEGSELEKLKAATLTST